MGFLSTLNALLFGGKVISETVKSTKESKYLRDERLKDGNVGLTSTYVDGFGTTRYVSDNSKCRGGQWSDDPAERARWEIARAGQPKKYLVETEILGAKTETVRWETSLREGDKIIREWK